MELFEARNIFNQKSNELYEKYSNNKRKFCLELDKFKRNAVSPPAIIYLCSKQIQNSLENVRCEIKRKGGLPLLRLRLLQCLKRNYLILDKTCKKHDIVIPRFITKLAKYFKYNFHKSQ